MNTEAAAEFRVQLDQYRGPVELLLYLVRRNELEIQDVTLSAMIEQYLEYLEVLQEIDINLVGDFLEIASLLIETKMRSILPSTDDASDIDDSDPREDLVHRLLLYKDFKDVSILLEEQSREWQNRYPRICNDLPQRKIDLRSQPIHEVELWDLVSSFGRVLKNSLPNREESIVLDDTPIHVYMQRVHGRLKTAGNLKFTDLFEPEMHKSALVGMFLAVLELVRHHHVRTEQVGEHGDIQILAGEQFERQVTIDEVTDY